MKRMFMVLAAIIFCGACFFTSCKKDKKNDDTPTPANNNVYEVNLTAIVHECSTPYLMINLEYTAAAVPGYTVPTEDASSYGSGHCQTRFRQQPRRLTKC